MNLIVPATKENIIGRLNELELPREDFPGSNPKALGKIFDLFLNEGWTLAFRKYPKADWVNAFPPGGKIKWPAKPPE